MDPDLQQRIARRAYGLWEQAGRPEGRDEEFWHAARAAELAQTQPAELGADPPADPAKFAGF